MNINTYILVGSGRLEPFTEKIKQKTDDSIAKISSKIPLSNLDIIIRDNPEAAIPEIGIGGYTPDGHTVFVNLNPEFRNIEKSINKELGRTLAHEINHAMRWRNPGYGKTLLEALVTEGLADHFDLEING